MGVGDTNPDSGEGKKDPLSSFLLGSHPGMKLLTKLKGQLPPFSKEKLRTKSAVMRLDWWSLFATSNAFVDVILHLIISVRCGGLAATSPMLPRPVPPPSISMEGCSLFWVLTSSTPFSSSFFAPPERVGFHSVSGT